MAPNRGWFAIAIASPTVLATRFVATGLILTCSQQQAAAFEEAQAAAETAAAEDLAEMDGASSSVHPFSEIAVIRSSDPTPAGFRRQQLHELGTFGAGVPAAAGVAGGDAGVHLCMSLNPGMAHISHVTTCTAPNAETHPEVPNGCVAVWLDGRLCLWL